MKKHLGLIILIFAAQFAFACKCQPLMPITKSNCDSYNAIFKGSIDSVSVCNEKGIAKAYFTIEQVFKGNLEKKTSIEFDCASSCLMSFSTNETWLIYATYIGFDVLNVSICSHSRKLFTDESNDIYALTAERSFTQEVEFLQQTFGIQKLKEAQTLTNPTGRNIQPSGLNKLLLIGVSLLVMAVIYFITQRKNGK